MDTFLAPEEHEDDADLEVDPYAADGPLAAAYAMCQAMAIPLPPFPEALLPFLEQTGTTVFTTRTGAESLGDRDTQVAAAASGEAVSMVGLSHEGYGTNNWS